jgi:hypothetical protein
MKKWLVLLTVIGGAAFIGSKMWPDVVRYLKIREM